MAERRRMMNAEDVCRCGHYRYLHLSDRYRMQAQHSHPKHIERIAP